jgi:hypothetical protein
MFVDSQALRGLEAGRAQRSGGPRFGGAARDDMTLPDADDFMHRETSMSRCVSLDLHVSAHHDADPPVPSAMRSGVTHFTGGAFYMPGDEEEEFAVLPDDVDMDALLAQGRRSGSAGARSPFSELPANGALPPLAEDDDDFPPLPAADDEDEPPVKKRKVAASKGKGILKKRSGAKGGGARTDDAIIIDGDILRAWLKDAASITCLRRKLGESAPGEPLGGELPAGAKGSASLSARVDAALKQPSALLLAGHRLPTQAGRIFRGRQLEGTLLHLFARHTAPGAGRRATAAVSEQEEEDRDMPMPMADDDDDVEAFRAGAPGPGRSPASSFGAPLFGRRSNVSAATGSASALAAALAGAKSPSSAHTAAARQRLSDAAAFGGAVLSDDLPDVGAPFPEDDAAHMGLSQRFESALPETGEGTQHASAPGVGLSGVSAGVMAYLANALGSESQAVGSSLVFDAMARGNSLSRTQTAQLFAQMLILATAGLVGVSQEAPYEDILISRGAVPLEAH